MKIIRALPLLAVMLTACVSSPPREWRTQGTIPAPAGGAAGYQHGPEHTHVVVGEHRKTAERYGYLRMVGDQGTLATNIANGSTFAAAAPGSSAVSLPPFGNGYEDHDKFVKDYFEKLGLPAEQVASVRAMTMVEAHGPSTEVGRAVPRITAYYSALQRMVEGVPVSDSFAWARANSRGDVVQEGVYWPAMPSDVVKQVHQFRELLADPHRLEAFKSRLGLPGGEGSVVIRHSAATAGDAFESFASYDVSFHVPTSASEQKTPAPGTTVTVTRHFDLNGTERFLPQEKLNLGDQYKETKTQAAKASTDGHR